MTQRKALNICHRPCVTGPLSGWGQQMHGALRLHLTWSMFSGYLLSGLKRHLHELFSMFRISSSKSPEPYSLLKFVIHLLQPSRDLATLLKLISMAKDTKGRKPTRLPKMAVEVGSLYTLRLESLKLVFQPLHKFLVNKL